MTAAATSRKAAPHGRPRSGSRSRPRGRPSGLRLLYWLLLGLVVYGLYGYRHSKLRARSAREP